MTPVVGTLQWLWSAWPVRTPVDRLCVVFCVAAVWRLQKWRTAGRQLGLGACRHAPYNFKKP